MNSDPIAEARRMLDSIEAQRERLIKKAARRPNGLLITEAGQPLTINGMPAVDFIRRAYDLGTDLNGPGRWDMHDPIQSELRNIKGWIEMAERDALQPRSEEAE